MNDEELIKETMMLDYSQLVMNNVYLHKENKELKQKIEYYENFEINKTIDKIRLENNKRFKEQQEELESLKQINEEHQKLNGELRVENDRLNNIIKRLETDLYNMYIAFGEFSEEYTENCIKKLKEGGDSENL